MAIIFAPPRAGSAVYVADDGLVGRRETGVVCKQGFVAANGGWVGGKAASDIESCGRRLVGWMIVWVVEVGNCLLWYTAHRNSFWGLETLSS